MNKRPVLVIEDDAMIRDSLREILEIEGYEVHTACNGLQGLEEIRKHPEAGVVLLDLQMPVMTGEQFLAALEKEPSPQLKRVPVLVLSARSESFSSERVSGFIRKPVDLDELLGQVQKLSG